MNIFKDDNNWNEKAIIGFIAFIIMCIIMIADLLTGWFGKVVHDLWVMLQLTLAMCLVQTLREEDQKPPLL